jgi:hypothetical protein
MLISGTYVTVENFSCCLLVVMRRVFSMRMRIESSKTIPNTQNSEEMAVSDRRPGERKSLVTRVKEYGIKPFTKNNLLFYYSPVLGVVSYSFLCINVMNPGLVTR